MDEEDVPLLEERGETDNSVHDENEPELGLASEESLPEEEVDLSEPAEPEADQ